MKKIIAIILALVMVAAFAACKKGETPATTGSKDTTPATESKSNETAAPAPGTTEENKDTQTEEPNIPDTDDPWWGGNEDPEIITLLIDTYEVGETIDEEHWGTVAQNDGQLPTIQQEANGNKYVNFRNDDLSGTEHDCRIDFNESTTSLFGDKYTVEFKLRFHKYEGYEYGADDVLFEIQPKGILADGTSGWKGNCRTIRFFAGGTMQSMGSTQAYKYNFDEWFTISISYNFEDDEVKIYYNGTLVIESQINVEYPDGLLGHAYFLFGQADMKAFPFNFDADDIIVHKGLDILAEKGDLDLIIGEFQTHTPESEAPDTGAAE